MKAVFKRDLVLWLIYSVYLFVLILPNLIMPKDTNLPWSVKVVHVLCIIISLYPSKLVSVYVGVPTLIKKIVYNEGYWSSTIIKLGISIILGVILYRTALYFIIYPYIYHMSTKSQDFFSIGRFLSNFADLTVPMLLFGAIWLYDTRLKADQEKAALELQFLKNQTSPHFLFNALNSIFGLVRKNDEQAAPALMKLSGILRYLLYESVVSKIALSKELLVVNEYLDIQKLRFGKTLQLSMTTLNDTNDLMISPGLILPLLENAFKFGFSDQLQCIIVDIQMTVNTEKQFMLTIKNHMSEANSSVIGGLGLKNLTRRLQLEYPNAHKYDVNSENGYYIVQLKLSLI
ncbi:MAG: histidine kinase [Saprospiraceae bacterium]